MVQSLQTYQKNKSNFIWHVIYVRSEYFAEPYIIYKGLHSKEIVLSYFLDPDLRTICIILFFLFFSVIRARSICSGCTAA